MSRRKQSEPCSTGETAAKRVRGEATEAASLTSQMDVRWKDDEKLRLLQALDRDGGKDDWDTITKAVQTRTVEEVKEYANLMMGQAGDISSTGEHFLQKWIQTTQELRSENDNIDGTCIPQLSSDDTATCLQKTSVGSQALHQGTRRKGLWSLSRSANSCPRHNCSCSVQELQNGSARGGKSMHDAHDRDKLYSSQRQLLELVTAQGEAIDKLTAGMNTANAFNSQFLKKLEHISCRLETLSSEMKTNSTGTPIVIQAPPRTTIIHQPIAESAVKENVHRPVVNSPVVTSVYQEATGTNQNVWPKVKAVASQVPFHTVRTQVSTSGLHVTKTTAAGPSKDVFFPQVSLFSGSLIPGVINCSPPPRNEVVTLGALAKVPIPRKHVPAASACTETSKESDNTGQNSMPAHEKRPPKAPQTVHLNLASSPAQCTPSSTSNLCCHGKHSKNCQTCTVAVTSPAKSLVPRKEASSVSTPTTSTMPHQRNSADSGSLAVDTIERHPHPEAPGHVTPEVQRSIVTSGRPEETAPAGEGDLGSTGVRKVMPGMAPGHVTPEVQRSIVTSGRPEETAPAGDGDLGPTGVHKVMPGMVRIGGKADVLLPKSLLGKFLNAAAGRPNILALRLAEGLFGHDVLMASTPNGIGNKSALNPHILQAIKDEILYRFAPECSPIEKKDLWRQCHTAIAQMCKRVRSSSVKRIMPRRSFDHTTELAHHEGKPDNHVESEYTGSETSLSDREDAHGFQEAQAESQEWLPMEEGSDITVVHIPSEFQCSEVRTDISPEEDPTPDQSNLPSTESHSGSDASGCSEDGVPIGGDEQLTIPKAKYLEALNRSGQATVFSVRLAELLFGDDVLEVSTVTGSRGTERLDGRILNAIQAEVSKRYLSNKDYAIRCSVWKKCLSSIATKCKMLRYTKPQKPYENWGPMDAEPP